MVAQVPVPSRLVPDHGASGSISQHAGVLQADLVPVVDTGRARHRHEKEERQLDATHVIIHLAEKSGRVVAAQQVQLGQRDLPVIPAQDRIHLLAEAHGAPGREPAAPPTGLRRENVASKGPQPSPLQRIVHGAIELVALEPPRGVVPNLTKHVCLGIDRLDPRAKLAPEPIVVNLHGHVQAPAVDAKLDPALCDIHQESAHVRTVRVELGQRRHVPPTLVTVGFQPPSRLPGPALLT